MYSVKTQLLIVDDNKEFTDILSAYLRSFDDFEVVGTAGNGNDAIEMIIEKQPDVVIIDIIMPHLDGLGVLENVKNMYLGKRPEFLVISAIGQDKTIQIALNLGAEYYMVKPFDMNDLVTRIRQLHSYSEKVENNELREKSIEDRATELLDIMGVPSHLKGYGYIIHAVKMVINDFTAINSVTKTIYADTAKKFRTTPERVERAIRNAIEITFYKGNLNVLNTMFPNLNNKTRPSNSQYIILLAEKLRQKNVKIG